MPYVPIWDIAERVSGDHDSNLVSAALGKYICGAGMVGAKTAEVTLQ
jgi:hypothetical protein